PLTEPLTLVHYGARGIEVIDPAFQGRGAPSEELRGGPVPTNRSYYYREGTETERRVLSLAKEKYVVTLQPGAELYNIADDPLGFGRAEDAITRIMEAGYDGFYNTASSLPGAVALFHPRVVEYVGYKTPGDYRGASTEGVVPVQRGVARLTVEFTPGSTTSVLPGIRTAPFDQRLEYTRAVQELMTDPQTGENILLQEEGLTGALPLDAMGFWKGLINPMLVLDVGMLPPDRPMPQDLRNRIERALAKIGLVAQQDGMAYSRGYFTDDPDAQNYIFLDMGRTISFEEARKIGKLEPIKNEGVALISTSAGVSLLNTGGFDSNPEFARWV